MLFVGNINYLAALAEKHVLAVAFYNRGRHRLTHLNNYLIEKLFPDIHRFDIGIFLPYFGFAR